MQQTTSSLRRLKHERLEQERKIRGIKTEEILIGLAGKHLPLFNQDFDYDRLQVFVCERCGEVCDFEERHFCNTRRCRQFVKEKVDNDPDSNPSNGQTNSWDNHVKNYEELLGWHEEI